MTHSAQRERKTLASYTINYNLGWWLTGYSLLFFPKIILKALTVSHGKNPPRQCLGKLYVRVLVVINTVD